MSDKLTTRQAALGEVLRRFTTARVGLERAGSAVATAAQLEFQLDHAAARDAVHAQLDSAGMVRGLTSLGVEPITVRSAVAPGSAERASYLRRPDLGRKLSADSRVLLEQHATGNTTPPELTFCIADGLSALAVERHALPLLAQTLPLMQQHGWQTGPACVVSQGRVAIGDEIGGLLQTKLLVMLIGERPGLSAADSLGVYLTWEPRPGRTDAERNCISNIREGGLGYADAAERILLYADGARLLGASGVTLRITNTVPRITDQQASM